MSLPLKNSIGGMFQTYKRVGKKGKYRVSRGDIPLVITVIPD